MALQHLKKLTAMGMALLTTSTMCSSSSYTELINAFPIMDDVMFGHYGNTSISPPLTAYSIGWRDNLDCLAYAKTYRVFFNYSR